MVLVSLSEGGEAYDILWKIIHCDNDCKLVRSYPFVSEVIQARKKPSQRFAAAFFKYSSKRGEPTLQNISCFFMSIIPARHRCVKPIRSFPHNYQCQLTELPYSSITRDKLHVKRKYVSSGSTLCYTEFSSWWCWFPSLRVVMLMTSYEKLSIVIMIVSLFVAILSYLK